MNKYILFGYDQYHPQGGLSDVIGSYINLADALSVATSKSNLSDWWYIIDRDTWETVINKEDGKSIT